MPIEPLLPSAILPWESDDLAVDEPDETLPALSLVVPIFNAGAYLERTLRSLALNNLDGVEVIVMDGASTDATPDILAHYGEILDIVVSEPDRGQSDALNKGFARATGDVFGWLNGDDLILPNTLNAVRAAFRDDEDAAVVVGDAAMVDLDLRVTHSFRADRERLSFDRLLDYAHNHLVQPSVFFTRAAWQEAGPLDESLHYAMDADLFLKMARSMRMVHLPVEVAYSVYHEGAKTRRHRAASITELALVQARHGGYTEARHSLDIMVDLYNEALAGRGERPQGTEESAFLAQRLAAVEAETEKNKRLLLRSLERPA